MRAVTYVKMAAAGVVCCVGGPALVYYLQPDQDELFKKYNPALQKRALEERDQKLKDHQEFLGKLREYSKSNKPIWVLMAEEEKKKAKQSAQDRRRIRDELERQRREILEEERSS